jgi:hypothetical protein
MVFFPRKKCGWSFRLPSILKCLQWLFPLLVSSLPWTSRRVGRRADIDFNTAIGIHLTVLPSTPITQYIRPVLNCTYRCDYFRNRVERIKKLHPALTWETYATINIYCRHTRIYGTVQYTLSTICTYVQYIVIPQSVLYHVRTVVVVVQVTGKPHNWKW